MNKGEFVEALADRLDVHRAQADRALSAVLDIIAEQLAKGEKVAFTGFGSFEVSQRAARTGPAPRRAAFTSGRESAIGVKSIIAEPFSSAVASTASAGPCSGASPRLPNISSSTDSICGREIISPPIFTKRLSRP